VKQLRLNLLSGRSIAACLLLFVVLMAAMLWRTPTRQFRYYILDPIPPSVANIQFQEGDGLRINPEPVSFMRFTASAADIEHILAAKGFKETDDSFNASGPPWWNIARSGPGIRVFVRQHGPKTDTKLFFGKNRRWTEVIRIDSTGTNVYFLVWGI